MNFLCFLAALLLLGVPAIAEKTSQPQIQEFPTASVDKLMVQQGAGKICVMKGDQKNFMVKAQRIKGDCDIQIVVKDKQLIVDTREDDSHNNDCVFDVVIKVPGELLATEIKTGSGDLLVLDLKSPLQIDAGSGDIVLKRVSGDREIKLGSGNLQAELLSGATAISAGSGDSEFSGQIEDLEAKIGSGDVTLKFNNLSKSAVGKVLIGSGDVKVALPAGISVEQESSFFRKKHYSFKLSDQKKYELDIVHGSGRVELQTK